ncbi:MAG: hypothetical protein QM522_09250 [Chitinophagaceae bacterium]|nr:hypothetical protein [Chitinophagaceae bacterium]
MATLLDTPDVWRNFVFPFVQSVASLAIASYAMKQEKIARLNAARENSEKFYKAFQGFTSLYQATILLEGRTVQWQVNWFSCRNAKDEAACLYGLHHGALQNKAKSVDSLFESGMTQCLGLVDLTEIAGVEKIKSGLAWQEPVMQEIHRRMNELCETKSKLFHLMYSDIQIRDSLDRASM